MYSFTYFAEYLVYEIIKSQKSEKEMNPLNTQSRFSPRISLTLLQNQNENPESQHHSVATGAMIQYPFEQNVGYDQYLEPH